MQLAVLVTASLVFYAWSSPEPLAIFLVSWLITGVFSHVVLSTPPSFRRTATCTAGVIANLGLLAFFKYKFLFIGTPVSPTTGSGVWHMLLHAPLPIGISFYTFHGVSLLVDIFRGNSRTAFRSDIRLPKHLGETLLYLVFFPQLIAGPIIKAKDSYPQVTLKRFREIDFTGCAQLLILGLFLKMVVADNLSQLTYRISFPYFQNKSSADLLILLYGYSAQIFADFGGYSLVAIGLARLLGYRLPDNFNFPYFSTSLGDFWRRWHISLSSWLRDYLYIPLGGNQTGPVRTYINLILVMFLGGLWHGAAWSFAIWGLWHGIGLALERRWRHSWFLTSDHPALILFHRLLVFQFVTIGWLFFKLQNFNEATLYLRALFINDIRGFSKSSALLIGAYAIAVFLYHLAHEYNDRIPNRVRSLGYGIMLFFILLNSGPSTPFIYFQF